MNRQRRFDLCAVLLLAFGFSTTSWMPSLRAQTASKDDASCRAFVQRFYDWYVFRMLDDECKMQLTAKIANAPECKAAATYHNIANLSLKKVLSPRLQKYLDLEARSQAKDEDAGLDFGPYLNSQDGSPKFVVESVQVKGNRCYAVVNGMDEGRKRERVMPELAEINGVWFFENFHYRVDVGGGTPPWDDDLIHMIREYIGEIPYANR